MALDYALVNLGVTIALLVLTFAFRKRILSALGRLLLRGTIEFARGAFLTEDVTEAEDGTKVARIGLSAQGRALVGAVTPVLIAEAAKSIKLKLPTGAGSLPPNLDLSNLSAALPAILSSGMIPKKYAGLVALLAPLAGQFLGGQAAGSGASSSTKNPFLKELQP